MTSLTYDVPDDCGNGLRLDRFVSEREGAVTRSQLKARLTAAKVNGKPVKLSRLLAPGDRIELELKDPEAADLLPEDIPLEVLYEDDRVVVVDKRQGLVVHPGAGNRSGTLANALLFRRLSRGGSHPSSNEGVRPGIVHRLDKDTSGVIIAAYDEKSHAFLADQFKDRSTRKTYLALVAGAPPAASGSISTNLARDPRDRKRFAVCEGRGKHALTLYRVLERYDGYTLVALRLKTGRTHQIRVHLKHIGCPILGDPIYGRKDARFPKATLMLHAFRLAIRLPGASGRSVFTAPVPERMRALIRALRARSGSSRP